ncbi:MAG TPA: TraR/DksA C4-type zinc finger protein [Alphaproteobacteria bacterium]|nr:TraR/DksA C4-type zinc finger protein [Alphaproteobacteria bacterium]
MSDPTAPRHDSFEQRLRAERATLTKAGVDTRAARAPVQLDQQTVGRLSRMDAMQVQAMDRAQEARRQTRIRMIDDALKRIESGDFGACVSCGEEILPARLEGDPAVPVCIDCARGADT